MSTTLNEHSDDQLTENDYKVLDELEKIHGVIARDEAEEFMRSVYNTETI